MTDLFKLSLGILASRFRAGATLEAENLVLRQQVNVLRRRAPKRPHLNNTDRFLFVWLYRWFPSVLEVVVIVRPETIIRWLPGVLALAIPQPCWQTEVSADQAHDRVCEQGVDPPPLRDTEIQAVRPSAK